MKRKLIENWRRIEDRMAEACARAHRPSTSVTLVAVTKSVSIDVIRTLVEAGLVHLGESRVQELAQRAAMLKEWLARRARDPQVPDPAPPAWHLVGHLQRNKVKQVLPWVDLIHSVDSLRLAEEIDTHSKALGRKTPVLLEINAGGENNKFGVVFPAATHLAEQIQSLPNLELRGLMAMAPLTQDETRLRRLFDRVRELFEEMKSQRIGGAGFRELSMGMSNDFEYAIESGATYVRIGTALFESLEQPAARLF
jgi:hypothetical protein